VSAWRARAAPGVPAQPRRHPAPRRLPATARRPDWFRSFPTGGRTQARQEPSEEGPAPAEAVAVVERPAAVEAEVGPVAVAEAEGAEAEEAVVAAGEPAAVEAEAAVEAAASEP
jgi:hypothetical protein